MGWKENIVDFLFPVAIIFTIVAIIAVIDISTEESYCYEKWEDSGFQVRYIDYCKGCQISEDGIHWMPASYYTRRR